MIHKLFKVRVKTYYFGYREYILYVLADNSDEALEYVYKHESYRNDEDAEVIEVIEIASETTGVI